MEHSYEKRICFQLDSTIYHQKPHTHNDIFQHLNSLQIRSEFILLPNTAQKFWCF